MLYLSSILSLFITLLSCSPQPKQDIKQTTLHKTIQQRPRKKVKVGAENIPEIKKILTNKSFWFCRESDLSYSLYSYGRFFNISWFKT